MDHRRAPLRVCIIDDHELIRRGLRALLSDAPEFQVVGEAGSLRDGLHVLSEQQPDIAVVGDRLPDGSGLDLVRRARLRQPQTRCLVLSSSPSSEAMKGAVRSGAGGYASKDIGKAQLLDMMRRVARGRTTLDWVDVGKAPGVGDRTRIEARELLAGLSPKERRILDLITEGCTNREIAAELFLAEKTVRNYVSNLLAKLGLRNRTQAATLSASETAQLVRGPTDDMP